jgi:hypothetical protein
MVVIGISPWVLPLIAIAAKLKEDDARRTRGRGFLRFWSRANWNVKRNARRNAERDRLPRDRPVMHERFRAKLEARIWPD